MIPKFDSLPYGDYQSPEYRPGLISRALPSATFYFRIVRIIMRASYKAKRERYSDEDWYQSSRSVHRAIERTGGSISIKGTGHLARLDEPCVIIGNHMSTAETFLLASIIFPFTPVTFVVKQALVDYPVFKHIMRSRDPIVVGRINPREDLKAVLEGGKERLRQGISLIIFPQRTRTVAFNRELFNTIGIKVARRQGVPVIPLALKTNAWGNGRLLKDYGRFRPQERFFFEFGEPIHVDNNERAAHQAVIDFIESRLTEWGLPPLDAV